VNTGGSAITGYQIDVRSGGVVIRTDPVATAATSQVVTGLARATTYRFVVRAVNAAGTSPSSALSAAITTPNVPGAPTIGTAMAGTVGGAITATANWAAPATNGGSTITGYQVTALRMNGAGVVLGTTVSAVLPATARTLSMTLPVTGTYRFQVVAINGVGTSASSARSNAVAGR